MARRFSLQGRTHSATKGLFHSDGLVSEWGRRIPLQEWCLQRRRRESEALMEFYVHLKSGFIWSVHVCKASTVLSPGSEHPFLIFFGENRGLLLRTSCASVSYLRLWQLNVECASLTLLQKILVYKDIDDVFWFSCDSRAAICMVICVKSGEVSLVLSSKPDLLAATT